MNSVIWIFKAAKESAVSPQYLGMLERQGRLPPARRYFNGRVYMRFDVALLNRRDAGSCPDRLRTAEEALGAKR